MLRSGPPGSQPLAGSVLRFFSSNTRNASRLTSIENRWPLTLRAGAVRHPKNLGLIRHKPLTTSLQKYASTQVFVPPDPEQIAKEQALLYMQKIEPHPEAVSSVSSVRQVLHEKEEEPPEEEDIDMLAGVKSDLVRYGVSFIR